MEKLPEIQSAVKFTFDLNDYQIHRAKIVNPLDSILNGGGP